MIRKLMLALASLCLLSFTSAALADETLSNSELQKLFPGSFTAVVNGIVVIEITAKDNGMQKVGFISAPHGQSHF